MSNTDCDAADLYDVKSSYNGAKFKALHLYNPAALKGADKVEGECRKKNRASGVVKCVKY